MSSGWSVHQTSAQTRSGSTVIENREPRTARVALAGMVFQVSERGVGVLRESTVNAARLAVSGQDRGVFGTAFRSAAYIR